jgi:hypothetical protein
MDALLPYVPVERKDLCHVTQNMTLAAVTKRRLRMACMYMSTQSCKKLAAAAKWPPRE